MKANKLSFAEVEDVYNITSVPRESFIVQIPDRDIYFHCRERLYAADGPSILGQE
jgi:hypothetical protein